MVHVIPASAEITLAPGGGLGVSGFLSLYFEITLPASHCREREVNCTLCVRTSIYSPRWWPWTPLCSGQHARVRGIVRIFLLPARLELGSRRCLPGLEEDEEMIEL